METEYTVLLVDDEPDIIEFLSYNLKAEGFRVYTANNGVDAVKIATEIVPDIIILDVMMPGMDGIETCVEIRKVPTLKNTRITFLTARAEDYSQIAGLDAGADDYIAKPVKPKVLISRIKAIIRRYTMEAAEEQDIITVGSLSIDRTKFVVTIDSRQVVLPKKEFELLYLLASKPNKVFTRDEIFQKIWDDNVVVGERTIDVHIRKIREKLNINEIKTIKGVGYKFEAE